MSATSTSLTEMTPDQQSVWVQKATFRLTACLVAMICGSALILALAHWWNVYHLGPNETPDTVSSIPVVWVSFVFGMTGGFISVQRRLLTLPKLPLRSLAESWSYTILSPLSGGVLAIVAFAIFAGGIVEGPLFPKFDSPMLQIQELEGLFHIHGEGPEIYAKLIFWSFVAGFSENFVLQIMRTAEAKV